MTKWQEFPLRPQGQAWPGLNTRGGVLDPGSGQLDDGSFNQIINEADLLEKRKGLTRGLDERFEDVVCDLHAIQQERKEGRLKLSEERNALEKRSHCDMAYANALALFCASDPVGKIEGFFGSDLVGGGARSAI